MLIWWAAKVGNHKLKTTITKLNKTALQEYFEGHRRRYACATALNGKIYVAGGNNSTGTTTNTAHCYDPVTNQWTSLTNIPGSRRSASLVTYNNTIWLFGGYSGSTDIGTLHYYNFSNNTWVSRASTTVMNSHSAVVIGNRMYVYGGNGLSGPRSQVHIYNFDTNQWTTGRSGATRRIHAAAAYKGKMYVAGGSSKDFGIADAISTAAVYDPEANTWRNLPPMPQARAFVEAYVIDNNMYVIGGGNSNGAVGSIAVLNLETETWSVIPSDPAFSSKYAYAGTIIGSSIYTVGGTSNAVSHSTDTLRFDPS